jgi:hypothetical protein
LDGCDEACEDGTGVGELVDLRFIVVVSLGIAVDGEKTSIWDFVVDTEVGLVDNKEEIIRNAGSSIVQLCMYRAAWGLDVCHVGLEVLYC